MGLGKDYKLKKSHKTTFHSFIVVKATLALVSKLPEEREFVVDSGGSTHMLSKKVLSSDEQGTLERSRTPTVIVTANGEVQTVEEVQVYVHDLGLFVIVLL